MKSNPLRKLLLLCLLTSSSFIACTHAYAQMSATAYTCVTARQYADFLNQNAASDPDYLYDDAMGTDPESACIVRLGTPGKYFYAVIEGREDFLVRYVSEFDEESYCDGLQGGNLFLNDENSDPYLKSNSRGFAIDASQSSRMLLLENSTTSRKSNGFLGGDVLDGSIGVGLALIIIRMLYPYFIRPGEVPAATLVSKNLAVDSRAREKFLALHSAEHLSGVSDATSASNATVAQLRNPTSVDGRIAMEEEGLVSPIAAASEIAGAKFPIPHLDQSKISSPA